MENKLYQCCYTKLDSGWKFIGVTEDMPAEMLALAEKMQIDHSKLIVNGKTFDSEVFFRNAPPQIVTHSADGSQTVFKLYEVAGDGKYVCCNATVYGALRDKVNRENIFAHALLMRWDDIPDADPNAFLTIDKSSFLEKPESLENQQPPTFTPPLEIGTAMERAGLTMDSYRTLVKTVYYQLKVCYKREPFFLPFDGSPEQYKAFLYCIYYGLPFYMRKLLRTATATASPQNIGQRDIIFTDSLAGRRLFMDPVSGKNTVLTPPAAKTVPAYVCYPLENLSLAEYPAYFAGLRDMASRLGADRAAAGKEEIYYTMAFLMLQNPDPAQVPTEALTPLFDACCAIPFAENETAQTYIARMLETMCDREVLMSAAAQDNFTKQEEKIDDPALQSAVRRYDVFRFSRMPLKDAVAALGQKGMYEKYARDLLETSCGKTILEEYYTDLLASDSYDIERLTKELDNISFIPDNDRIVEQIEQRACGICRNSFLRKDTLALLKTACFRAAAYMQLIKKIYGEDIDTIRARRQEITGVFWENVHYGNLVLGAEARELYRRLENSSENCARAMEFCDFAIESAGLEAASLRMRFHHFFNTISFRSMEEYTGAFEKISAYYRENALGYREEQKELFRILAMQIPHESAERLLLLDNELEWSIRKHCLREKELGSQLDALFNSVLGTSPNAAAPISRYVVCRLMKAEAGNEGLPETEILCVPLDIWLLLNLYGRESETENLFSIFDKLDAEVLREHPEDVAEESDWLRSERVQADLQQYITRGSEQSKIVKIWWDTWRKQEKKKQKEAIRQEKEAKKEARREEKREEKLNAPGKEKGRTPKAAPKPENPESAAPTREPEQKKGLGFLKGISHKK